LSVRRENSDKPRSKVFASGYKDKHGVCADAIHHHC
jgi:hypothetical protein